MPGQQRIARRQTVGVAIPLAIVVTLIWIQLWHGPTVLTVSATHGLDTGDLLIVPFVLLAVAVARRRPVRGGRPSWTLPVSAVVLGALLMLSGNALLTSEGGPLMPGAGATLDGTITQTIAANPIGVDDWTHLALTYDGTEERLYVNGREVSRHAAHGRIETPDTPLRIGGNTYHEDFIGLVDDVRVSDRALSRDELRRDMSEPVRPAPGLVAAYGFDEGSGRIAADVSGHRNAGRVEGATTWTRGRHGGALRFDGSPSSVVLVPPSRWLDLSRAMTLSAWVRPTVAQEDWRAIVQREVDTYFLTAGSDRIAQQGAADAVRTIAMLLAAGWFAFVIASGGAPRTAVRQRTWWLPVLLFTAGSLVDAASFPTGTLVGPLLVALWLAVTADAVIERTCLWLAAAAFLGVTLASLANFDQLSNELVRYHGSAARSIALGLLFVLAGSFAGASERRARMRGA